MLRLVLIEEQWRCRECGFRDWMPTSLADDLARGEMLHACELTTDFTEPLGRYERTGKQKWDWTTSLEQC